MTLNVKMGIIGLIIALVINTLISIWIYNNWGNTQETLTISFLIGIMLGAIGTHVGLNWDYIT